LIDEKISDLYKKVSKCSKCHPNSPIHVPGPDPCNGGIGAEVLFILERPGTKGAIEKVSFDNKDGTAERAKRLLKTAGISRKNIFIANTVFCRDKSQPTNVKVTKDEKDACSKYLKELIEKDFIIEHKSTRSRTYAITQKGRDFFNKYKFITDFVDSFGLN